ncbi:MAG: small ribosomal subunit Rsm22 family protein [Bdellovibrionota bacterium]
MESLSLEKLENIIISYIYEISWNQTWDGRALPHDVFKSYLSHVEKLSNLFTVDRGQMGIRYFRKKENRIAYFLYFHLANMMRTRAIITEMKKRKVWPKQIDHVMDLGTGSGASIWAFGEEMSSIKDKPKSILALDEDRAILKDAEKLWTLYGQAREMDLPDLSCHKVDLLSLKGLEALHLKKKLDVIFCSNLVNEFSLISESGKISLFRYLVDSLLSDDGVLVIMEPASKEISRDLIQLRAMLLDCIDIHIPLPCSGTHACPLVADREDWCHLIRPGTFLPSSTVWKKNCIAIALL